jgi:ferric-dicitrate binding protein FerR (iron transport regulator)
MNYSEFDNYLSNNATEEEVLALFKWIEASSGNKEIFIKYKKAWVLTAVANEDTAKEWKEIQKVVQKRNRNKILPKVLKYAAVFIGVIGVAYLFQMEKGGVQQLQFDDKLITIQLDNGEIEVLTSNGTKQILDQKGKLIGVQNGSLLNYYSKQDVVNNGVNTLLTSSTSLEYNELTVPYGKTFRLVLSDGTSVSLNAGTSLKYPIRFIKGKDRQVFLKGEAYFDVTKDTENPFVVNVNEMNVRVLGTQFNVSSYPEDLSYNTVLVEGSVGIYKKGEQFDIGSAILLKPGFRAAWNKDNKAVNIEKVNTNIYTGWVVGKLIFKNLPFKNIRKKLERHYNITIVNNNKALESKTYNATFDTQKIEEVMEILNKSFSIKYKIENNKVIIN